MEKDERIVGRRKVGDGPKGESIFYVITTKDDKTFEHVLGCPDLKKTAKILGQEERNIPEKKLEKDVSLFQEILKTTIKSKSKMRI